MIGRIIHYHQLRRNSLSHKMAMSMSGLRTPARKLMDTLILMLCVVGVLYLMSADANSKQITVDKTAVATIERQSSEIKALEQLLTTCLTRGDHPIYIGDELVMCGAAYTGIKREVKR